MNGCPAAVPPVHRVPHAGISTDEFQPPSGHLQRGRPPQDEILRRHYQNIVLKQASYINVRFFKTKITDKIGVDADAPTPISTAH
jgi:hypothetical protein